MIAAVCDVCNGTGVIIVPCRSEDNRNYYEVAACDYCNKMSTDEAIQYVRNLITSQHGRG